MDMKHVKYLALVLCIGNLSPVMAQTASKSLTVDNLVAWQRISGQAISDNGTVSYTHLTLPTIA